MKILVVGIVVAILLALGTFAFVNSQRNQDADQGSEGQATTNENTTSNQNSKRQDAADSSEVPETVAVTYTGSGFSPSEAKLRIGGQLTWVNNSSSAIQIGVDPHPTHTGNRVITDGEFVITLNPGESRTVTVNESGRFGYHNHLDSFKVGKVVVE